ncbi:MAG: gliding motility-associated C-terminal domain-containing protein [Bacteroidota bacterium]|nr:gliding motility-associated C-terminal domain-containing protein [Bacteroidota bacterium]
MIKKYLFCFALLFILIGGKLTAQDVAVINITAPSSGCNLTATENVVVRIFNYGPTDLSGVNIPVSYSVNGVPIPAETANFPSFLQNSTVTYTFTAVADLSAPASYTIDATTSLAGDINTTNDAFTGYTVTNTAPSVGGTVSGGTNVCITGNAGNLTLAGHTGNVLNWEYSTDGGSTWINISNTTTSQSYSNLTVQTQYRANVQNGSCTTASSTASTITIDPATVGGTAATSSTICSGASGNITLSGHTGAIQYWEYSTDGGATWTNIANTATTQPYVALTTTTRYRANVQSGACTSVNSTVAIKTVNPTSVGGTVSPAATTVCSGSNGGTLTLSGHTGTISRWEYSTDGGTTWTNIVNTTTSQNYTNLTTTTQYRALVKSGVCSATYSAISTITVTASTVGGSVTSDATICSGLNGGTLTLAGESGTILNWESSIDGGTTWTTIANTTNSEIYTNIIVTTHYRAVVQNGTCTASNSTAAILTVNNASVGGNLSSDATVCASANSGTITLAGQTGSIQNWESSTDGGATWTNIANTTTSNNFNNLTDTTLYRAAVKNGVCASAYSDTVTITVDPVTVGGIVSSSASICSGLNTGTLNLSGNTGSVLSWEYSTDGGSTWINISNTTTSQSYNNVSTNTIYRSLVQSGVCSSSYSGTATLTVDPQAVGGTTYGTATVCEGANNGSITLVGYSSSIASWESSTDGGTTWAPIVNTSAVLNYTNLLQSTTYHAITSSGVCPDDTSSITVISVDIPSVGGLVSTGDTVCAGVNGGILNLSGNTGNVQNWEYSTDNGTSWVLLSNATATQSYANLTQSTYFRASVKNGVCATDLADSVYIKVDSAVVAGSISSPATVCISNANGTLTLAGYIGSIVDWESSADNGTTWSGLTNTTNTNNYAALTDTTYYRAIVSSGVCGNDTTASLVINVDQLSVGGTIDLSQTVCASGNGATLNIIGSTGNVLGWEYSSNGGNSWIPVNNTTLSQVYTNLTQTTYYRATLKNGVCPVAYADTAIIIVDPIVEAGSISSPATLCISNANGTLTLNGYTGSITDWESSADNGTTWSSLANTTNTNAYTALTDTTYYRAIVTSGVCGNDTTATTIIGIDQLSVGGTINTADTVCASANADTLALTGYTGTITGWEFSTNNGASWMTLTNTNDSLTYVDLSSSTSYHAIIKNGVCPSVYSATTKITVDAVTNPGIITGGTIGCESNNNGTLNLSNSLGQVNDWIYSTDNGATWQSSGVTTTSYFYTNIPDTTVFQAIVQNGVCAKDTAAPITILVYARPNVSFTVDSVCFKDTTHLVNLTTLSSGFISTFTWNYGDGNSVSNVNQNYVYASVDTFTVSLTAFSNFGCSDTATAAALIKRIPNATILNASPLSFCPGDSTVLNFDLDSNATYTWSTLATDTFTVVDSSAMILLTVTDTLNGCIAKDSVEVVQFQVDSISAGEDTTITLGTLYVLQGYGSGNISWTPVGPLSNPLILNPEVTLSNDTTFVLQITDVNSCVSRDTVNIKINYDYTFDVKNIITPNGDGLNDVWHINNIESYPDNEVTVFNREGNIVFKTSAYKNDWEGTFNGKTLSDGAYFYIIKFEKSDKVLKGDINILSNK